MAALQMPRNGSLTKHKGTGRGDQGGQLGRNHGCHDQDNNDQDDDHEDLCKNVGTGASVTCQKDRQLLETHIVKTPDSPIKIPHRSLQSELFTVNLNDGHVEFIPRSVTILVPIEHGKGDLSSLFVGEETGDITK